MESVDICSNKVGDEDAIPLNTNLDCDCHGLAKHLEMSSLHVVFGLRGVLG
jgi:hypothetical protein